MAERVDVAVVGGGPAGVAAACRAGEAGARVALLDAGLAPGGQIFRPRADGAPAPHFAPWLARLERSSARVLARTDVFDLWREGDGWRLAAETPGGRLDVAAGRVVLATGARELLLPFPGWTLPGVMTAGGAQALVKSGMDVDGMRVVVAGSGPLLVPVAATLERAGATVALVAEQASAATVAGFGVALARRPGALAEAVGARAALRTYRPGAWVTAASGTARVRAAVVRDRRGAWRVACDVLAVSHGLVPNTELARHAGCALDGDVVRVDAAQATTAPGVFAAGEPCGVAGAQAALVEGEIAGLAAASRFDAARGEGRRLARARDAGRRYAALLARSFRLRRELDALARSDTIVCRCEDVRFGDVDPAWGARRAKLYCRAGMGACQGRVCGPVLRRAFGWEPDAVRAPVLPVALATLCGEEEED